MFVQIRFSKVSLKINFILRPRKRKRLGEINTVTIYIKLCIK